MYLLIITDSSLLTLFVNPYTARSLFIELYDDIVFPAQHHAVSSMWLNRLALFFSSSDRFALERPRNSGEPNLRVRVLSEGNRGLGTVLLNAKPLDPNEGQSLKESVWSNWRSQLEDHVSRAWGWLHVVDEQLHDAANIARFGAITIGREVQFFECIPGGRSAIRAFGHGEDELLEFKADEAKIIEIVDEIRRISLVGSEERDLRRLHQTID